MADDILTSALQVFGSGGFAVALIKGIEAVSQHRQRIAEARAKADVAMAAAEADAVKVAEREATERTRLKQDELGIAEKLVLDRAAEHRAALEQVVAARAAAAASAAEAAAAKQEAAKVQAIAEECQRDRRELHSIIAWFRKRLDKLDGGSMPPPPSSYFPDPDVAE